jgi:riboflavin kinase/FMN adenylyltransferase
VKIIRSLNQITKNHPTLALTIGNFDGIHLGHLEIINQVKKIAKEKNLASAILTFEPHPTSFFKPKEKQDFRLTSLAEKLRILQSTGIDYAIILPFNKRLSVVKAEDFVKKILIKRLKVQHLTIGYDFTFGKNREGNFKTLESFSLDLKEVSPVKKLGKTCSSTQIRKLISEGKITEANKILGRNFTINGLVNLGRKIAAQLDFPTANLKTKSRMIRPKFGVYKTTTFIPHLNKKFNSVTNFGIKPTLNSREYEPIFETHIINFNQDLYGKKIHVEFLKFIRPEKKFSSLPDLKKQIMKDIKSCYSKD